MELLFATLLFISIYALQNYLYKKYWNKNIDIEMHFSSHYANVSDNLILYEKVVNNKILPLPSVTASFFVSKNLIFSDNNNSSISDNYYRHDIFSIMNYQQVNRTIHFTPSKRGFYQIHDVKLKCTDLFLSKEYIVNCDCSDYLYVFPKKIVYKDFPIPLNSIIGNYLSTKFTNEDPFEFKNIREYQPFDNINSINWKSSAKTNKLMVNVHNPTSSLKVTIVLNLDGNNGFETNSIFEKSISIASSISQHLTKQNIPVSLYTNGIDILTNTCQDIDFGSGSNHQKNIDKSLARIDLSMACKNINDKLNELIKKSSNNSMIILISNYRKDELYNIFINENNKNNNITWILPYNKVQKIDNKIMQNKDILKWEVKDIEH